MKTAQVKTIVPSSDLIDWFSSIRDTCTTVYVIAYSISKILETIKWKREWFAIKRKQCLCIIGNSLWNNFFSKTKFGQWNNEIFLFFYETSDIEKYTYFHNRSEAKLMKIIDRNFIERVNWCIDKQLEIDFGVFARLLQVRGLQWRTFLHHRLRVLQATWPDQKSNYAGN